ncbi:hypothetical protein [Gordonia sp. (in: high G+C Gram-positive bacteria)]|uniref:hypothetical protein n=1 Tax=Gordonia sp. (in: high G+C Gram-positive bacteria) TaxID=84139 RepID=UPI0025BB76C5|nr:hypothetical protein [Gordonia sp. (in: high G+C Gram-positive bacteria)]
MLRSSVSRTSAGSRAAATRVVVFAAVAAALLGTAACGDDDGASAISLPNLLLAGDQLPPGFAAVPMDVNDLIVANRATLEQAESVAFDPKQCGPTADAEFNPQLTDENTALLVGRSDDGTFSELASTVRRNVDADRRATTGPCRVVTAVPSRGSLAGARIVTTSVELPAVSGPAVDQAFLLRSDSVTTLPSGAVRARAGLMANVLVRAANGEVVTLQVGLSTLEREISEADRAAVAPGTPLVAAPVSDDEFIGLVRSAVARAAQ